MGVTTREELAAKQPVQVAEVIISTLQEYSDRKQWPVPFGMDGREAGYELLFKDGDSTWVSAEQYKSGYE